jgi:hypothetical protein
METENSVPVYKVVLMIGSAIVISISATWVLLVHHESRPHRDAVAHSEFQVFVEDSKEWQRQQTELLKTLIIQRYRNPSPN